MKVTKPEITIDREEFADLILQCIRVCQDRCDWYKEDAEVTASVLKTMLKCFDSMVNE